MVVNLAEFDTALAYALGSTLALMDMAGPWWPGSPGETLASKEF